MDPQQVESGIPNEGATDKDAERMETQANTNAVSRAIAVMVLMILPGIAGSYLDGWLGTQFFVLIGFFVGIFVAIVGLLYVAKIADVAAQKSREMRKKANRDLSGDSNRVSDSDLDGKK